MGLNNINHVPVHSNGVAPPGAVEAALQGFFDCNPEAFPNGCEVVFIRPGQLERCGQVTLPKGCLLLYAPPELAEQLRSVMRTQIEKAKKAFGDLRG